jgi:hypothetical protein
MTKEGLPMRSDIFNLSAILMSLLLCSSMLLLSSSSKAQDKANTGQLDIETTNVAIINSEQSYLNTNSSEAPNNEGINQTQFEIHEAWFYVMGFIILVMALKAKDGSEQNESERDKS